VSRSDAEGTALSKRLRPRVVSARIEQHRATKAAVIAVDRVKKITRPNACRLLVRNRANRQRIKGEGRLPNRPR